MWANNYLHTPCSHTVACITRFCDRYHCDLANVQLQQMHGLLKCWNRFHTWSRWLPIRWPDSSDGLMPRLWQPFTILLQQVYTIKHKHNTHSVHMTDSSTDYNNTYYHYYYFQFLTRQFLWSYLRIGKIGVPQKWIFRNYCCYTFSGWMPSCHSTSIIKACNDWPQADLWGLSLAGLEVWWLARWRNSA